MRWVLFVALAWMALVALFAIAVQSPARPPHASPASATSHLARELSAVSTTGHMNPPWVVSKASAAMHALVVHVDARRPQDARTIAEEIVAPVRGKYEEILVYVRAAGAPQGARVHRIQWTPRRGFVESEF
jgi:hypothetical protein